MCEYEKALLPDSLVNQTTDTLEERQNDGSNGIYNELAVMRVQNDERKKPDYIVIFKKDGEIKHLDEAKKASEQWEIDGKLMPIVVIDIDKCLENQKRKTEKLLNLYEQEPSEKLREQIVQKVRNNQATLYTRTYGLRR